MKVLPLDATLLCRVRVLKFLQLFICFFAYGFDVM